MLTVVTAPVEEMFDEATNRFLPGYPSVTLKMEHSLLALSKWESKHQVPFLGGAGNEEKTNEQIMDYLEFMVLNPEDVPSWDIFKFMAPEDRDKINAYISSKETATTFNEHSPPGASKRGETITSELVYYWMVAYNIPFECETWNLNRLFTLIKVCSIKNSPQKKMPKHSIASRNRELNQARRAQLGTSG